MQPTKLESDTRQSLLTCLDCKRKYICSRKTDIHYCDKFTDHYTLIKIEYEVNGSLTSLFVKSTETIKTFTHFKTLNCYCQKELGLIWKEFYDFDYKGFFQDPNNKFKIYKIE